MPCGHLNAMRFAQKPLPQPNYSFVHVPKAKSNLENSSLQLIKNREHFQECMAEFLLLSKEAVRRRKNFNTPDPVVTNSGAKPLSLEYIADRTDVDDPCEGFIVRTKTKPEDCSDSWAPGMAQGFITLTTFTSWQRSFRWDSLHPEAYSFDSDSLTAQRKSGKRKWDSTGELAKELQQTVHKGDVWNEGVVWPRVCEISLLGALGCGRTLVKLAIEHLENMKPTAGQNYDYAVLQATDNSIPFYESLGFVRVGGIMEEKKDSQEEEEDSPMTEVVTSEVTKYVTKNRGERIVDIAKKFKADVWDVIFLNKGAMPSITPTSKLLLGTTLEIPVMAKDQPRAPIRASTRNAPSNNEGSVKAYPTNAVVDTDGDGVDWYIAKENDTPTKISKMFKCNCQELLVANRLRLKELMRNSRLKAGTRIQISHLHTPSKAYTAYAHWSNDSDSVENGEPSYLMCYKLNKPSKRKAKEPCTPVLSSLATFLEDYTRSPLLLMPPDEKSEGRTETAKDDLAQKRRESQQTSGLANNSQSTSVLLSRDTNRAPLEQEKSLPPSKVAGDDSTTEPGATQDQLQPPKRAVGAFVLFCADMRERKKELISGLSIADASRVLADRWRGAPLSVKQKFEQLASEAKQDYLKEKEAYKQQLLLQSDIKTEKASGSNEFYVTRSDEDVQPVHSKASKKKRELSGLFNKVVKLKPESIPFTARVTASPRNGGGTTTEERRFKYWFCLTVVPDLQWVHLVPMVECGTFDGDDKKVPPHLIGMTKWKLIDEAEGEDEEIELSSRYVIPVKSRETKKSADANKEEWAIFDGEGTCLSKSGRKRNGLGAQTNNNRSKKKRTDISIQEPYATHEVTCTGTCPNPDERSIVGSTHQTPGTRMDKNEVHGAASASIKLPPMDLNGAELTSPMKFHKGGNTASPTMIKLPPMDVDLAFIGQEVTTRPAKGEEHEYHPKPRSFRYPPQAEPYHDYYQNPRYSAPHRENYHYDPRYEYHQPSSHNAYPHYAGPPSWHSYYHDGHPPPTHYEHYGREERPYAPPLSHTYSQPSSAGCVDGPTVQ